MPHPSGFASNSERLAQVNLTSATSQQSAVDGITCSTALCTASASGEFRIAVTPSDQLELFIRRPIWSARLQSPQPRPSCLRACSTPGAGRRAGLHLTNNHACRGGIGGGFSRSSAATLSICYRPLGAAPLPDVYRPGLGRMCVCLYDTPQRWRDRMFWTPPARPSAALWRVVSRINCRHQSRKYFSATGKPAPMRPWPKELARIRQLPPASPHGLATAAQDL